MGKGLWVGLVLGISLIAGSMPALAFIVPYNGDLYLTFMGGSAAANSDFGVVSSIGNLTRYFTGLPNYPSPTSEVFVGSFSTNYSIDFYVMTDGKYGYSNQTDDISREVFNGGIQQTGEYTFLLYLDDAMSTDNDNNDILMQIRISPTAVPIPGAVWLFGSGLAGLIGLKRRSRVR